MTVPMIDTLSSNESFDNNIFPATEADAKIKRYKSDGDITEFEVDSVEELDIHGAQNEKMFCWKEKDIPKWKVYVTDQRIVLWHPYSKGLIGKPKEKQGKSTGGHLLYGSILRVAAWINAANGPVLAVMCLRDNGQRKTLFLMFSDEDNLKNIAKEMNKRINLYIEKTDNALSEDNDMFKENPDIKEKWNSFPSDMFVDKDAELNVILPMNSWEMAPSSRLS